MASERLVGDSYSADPSDLRKLRCLKEVTGVGKSEHIRRAIRAYLVGLVLEHPSLFEHCQEAET